jgi:hypothetical protein
MWIFRFRVDHMTKGLRLARCVAGRVEGLSVRGAKESIDRGWVFVDNRRIRKASRPAEEGEWVHKGLVMTPCIGRLSQHIKSFTETSNRLEDGLA